MSAVPNLRVVQMDEAGEIVGEGCTACAHREDVITGLEGEIRSLAAKITQLKRDKEQEAREHPLWPTALQVFKAWKALCNHPKAAWGADRFEEIRPYLQDKAYGKTLEERKLVCLRAIVGAAFDPYITRRKNGSPRRHDGWDLVFRSRDKLEEFANKAPADWRDRLVAAVPNLVLMEVA